MSASFEYGVCRLKDVRVSGPAEGDALLARNPSLLTLDGRTVRTTKRFWNSLQIRFGFTPNIFRYFGHGEVFERISAKNPNDEMRWCLEHGKDGRAPRLLAVSSPKSAVITHDDLSGLLSATETLGRTYHDGVVRSEHAPKHAMPFAVAGDGFECRYVIETPIDGFGRPSIYLAMLRQICSNGAIAMTPAFRSELATGRGNGRAAAGAATFALTRALEGFNNEEGFAALRQRFDGSTRSWASVHEAQRLYKIVAALVSGHEVGGRIRSKGHKGEGESVLTAFHRLTGDIGGAYGLANLDALSVKRQRTLPAPCRVYDLLNFASELATHHAMPAGARKLHAYIGDLVGGEYDLENTADQFSDWRDFFLAGSATAGKTGA